MKTGNFNRNEGKDFFEINSQTGEVFTKAVFDRYVNFLKSIFKAVM